MLDCLVTENQKLLSNVAFDNLYRPILYDLGQFLASLLNFMEKSKIAKNSARSFDAFQYQTFISLHNVGSDI